jgi:hypothetical protein
MFVMRRRLFAVVAVDAVLLLIAALTAGDTSNPGTVSDVAWFCFLVGALLLIVLGAAAVVRARWPAD